MSKRVENYIGYLNGLPAKSVGGGVRSEMVRRIELKTVLLRKMRRKPE